MHGEMYTDTATAPDSATSPNATLARTTCRLCAGILLLRHLSAMFDRNIRRFPLLFVAPLIAGRVRITFSRFDYDVSGSAFNLFVNASQVFANDTEADHEETPDD